MRYVLVIEMEIFFLPSYAADNSDFNINEYWTRLESKFEFVPSCRTEASTGVLTAILRTKAFTTLIDIMKVLNCSGWLSG